MSALNVLGYRLIPGKPNAEGLCMFVIVDSEDCEVATIDRPCTLDEAFAAARRFAESEMSNEE